MQLKKIAIVFLVVIMTLSLAAIGIAAEGASSDFTLSAKAESNGALANDPLYVKSGDVIKYVVSVDSNPGNLYQIEIFADFDTDVLVLQNITLGSVFDLDKVALVRTSSVEKANEKSKAQVWVLADEDSASDKTGAFVTFEFKMNSEFDGKIDDKAVSFETSYSVGKDALKEYKLATPAVHAHHYGEPTSVAGDCQHSATTVYECTAEGCTDAKLVVPTGVLGDHNLVKVEKVEPTVDRPGNEEHYKCSVCNKFFDAEGKEISYPSIPQLEKPSNNRNNTAVTVIIIVVAVVVVAAGAAAAVVVLKKKKIL